MAGLDSSLQAGLRGLGTESLALAPVLRCLVGSRTRGDSSGAPVMGPFHKATLDSSLATTPWPSHVMSLSLSFPSYKMELSVLAAWGGGGYPEECMGSCKLGTKGGGRNKHQPQISTCF